MARDRQPETEPGIRGLILVRGAVTTLLLVSVVGVYRWGALAFPLGPFLALVGAAYAFCAVSWAVLRWRGASRRFAEVQIYLDVLLVTALVYVTGGASSFFPFFYLFSILAASIMVTPRRSFVTATLSVVSHGLLLDLVFYRLLPPLGPTAGAGDVVAEGSLSILVIAANTCASYTVAYLATYLAEQLRRVRTEARETQASLAELQVLHEDIVQSVSSGLVTFDLGGQAMTANRTVEALSGRPQAALQGQPWAAVFEGAPPFEEVWQALGARRAPYRFEAFLRRADGRPIPVGVSASPLRRGVGDPVGVICSFQDLTEIKRMEARVRHADRLAAIGRLAAGLAHEIRNPIAAIRGSIEVLGETLRLQGTERRLMEIVLRESDRLDQTIAGFLEFSRPQPPRRTATDLGALVDEVLVLVGHHAGERVRVVRDGPEGTAKAAVDPAQVRQALWNLCRNALDAMPEGGTLRVAVRPVPRPDREAPDGVELAVEDTGPGIPAEDLPHIFEPFYTTRPQGTGLGLAIVHRIVEEHGGQVRVEPREGGGTRFVLTLPAGGA